MASAPASGLALFIRNTSMNFALEPIRTYG